MRIFEGQCKIGLDNLERLHHAVGERIQVIFVSGTDFGMQVIIVLSKQLIYQTGTLISPRAYREMYQPFHKKINDWIHAHTTWKVCIWPVYRTPTSF